MRIEYLPETDSRPPLELLCEYRQDDKEAIVDSK